MASIDMGSHALKAALFIWEAREPLPRLIKKMVVQLPINAPPKRVMAKLNELLDELVQDTLYRITQVYIGVGPSIAQCATAIWQEKLPAHTARVTRPHLAQMFDRMRGERPAPEASEGETRVYPVQISIRGYPLAPKALTSSPHAAINLMAAREGAKTPDLAFRVLSVTFSKAVSAAISQTQTRLQGIAMDFFPLALAYRDMLVAQLGVTDVLLVDMGGEETSIIRIKEAAVHSILSFPMGVHEIVRTLARDTSCSLSEAEDTLVSYSQGTIAGHPHALQIPEALNKSAIAWKNLCITTLDATYQEGPLPSDIWLTGGGAAIPEVASWLRTGDWIRGFSYVQSPAVRVLAANQFFGGDSIGGFLNGPEDSGLAALIRRTHHPASVI